MQLVNVENLYLKLFLIDSDQFEVQNIPSFWYKVYD